MKTVTRTRYQTEIQEWKMSWWNDEIEESVNITDTEEGIQNAATYHGVSAHLIDSLQMTLIDLRDHAKIDLIDIWKRLDMLEARIAQLEQESK